uniref:Uncharacterized protein n=1 Tax=Globodera pallida TaxID=36090 RepID=A0A183C9S9_GLOPA
MLSFPKLIFLALILQILVHCLDADPKKQLGFICTSKSTTVKDYGRCEVNNDVLRFFIVGDIGGEEYKLSKETTVADQQQQQCTVDSGEGTVAVHSCFNFLLNTGDNFYEHGVTFDDAITRFNENFVQIYNYPSLDVPCLKLNCLMANGPFPPNIMWYIITLDKTTVPKSKFVLL